jgi:hypothetical protein
MAGLRIRSCVHIKQQYLIIFCFFFVLIMEFSGHDSNIGLRGQLGGMMEDASILLGISLIGTEFLLSVP